MKNAVFLTGATGFLGREIMEKLVERNENRIYVLVRAKTDFYFLNDFGALVETLPKVRPTVFFSVPRFYEKLWDQLASNKMGQKSTLLHGSIMVRRRCFQSGSAD